MFPSYQLMGIIDRLRGLQTKTRSPRLGVRIATELRVDVRVARDGAVHSVLLEDLSTTGARISTPVPLQKRDVLTLVLEQLRDGKIETICRVASIRPRRGELHVDYGLKFIGLRPADADAIRRYVASQQLQAAGATAYRIRRTS